jgi:hypothetical protein
MIKSFAVLLAVFAAATVFAAAPTVTLTGKAQSCYGGLPIRLVGVSGVEVSAFRVSSVPSLMANLNAFDSTAGSSAMTTEALMRRLDTLSTRAYSVVKRSKVLARAVSDSLGNFNLRIPVTDSVLIYAVVHDEDDTFPDVHMTMSGRTSRSFILDTAHGGCTPEPT